MQHEAVRKTPTRETDNVMSRFILAATFLASLAASSAHAQIKVRIGVLTDLSSALSAEGGSGSVLAARLAVEDFRPQDYGMAVDLLFADHQNKPDVGLSIARNWIDNQNVDVISDVPSSSIALAVSGLVREKSRIMLASSAGSSDLTGKACSPNTVQWTYDTWAEANGVTRALIQEGLNSWYFITADYAFGRSLQADASTAVAKDGGTVLGSVQTPFPTADFSSFLIQASGSGAKVIALANAGSDTITSIKQAAEFGTVGPGRKLVALTMGITDVEAIGLETAQGLVTTASTYWDLNEGTRAFSARFAARSGGMPPGEVHMGVYASILHYLKAVAVLNDKDSARVMAQMRAMPTDDPMFGRGQLRPDGRVIHAMYVVQVKTPAEAHSHWDVFKIIATIPADQAFRPLNQGGCTLVAQ